MFAYCLNNPVVHTDESGSAAKTCLTADGAIDDTPWWDHSPGGGGFVYHYTTQSCGESRTQRFLRETWSAIKNDAKWVWDTYSQEYLRLQNVQMQEAQLMLDGITETYDYLEKTAIISIGKNGYHSVMAANEGKQAMAYLFAPLPSPVDEYLAVCHGLKALYHLYLAGMEVVQ